MRHYLLQNMRLRPGTPDLRFVLFEFARNVFLDGYDTFRLRSILLSNQSAERLTYIVDAIFGQGSKVLLG